MEAAKRIPIVLAEAGLKTDRMNSPGILSPEDYLKLIEEKGQTLLNKMAQKEHDLWVEFYMKNGWEYAPLRNDYHKKHNCLKPYKELPEDQKDKDKNIIRLYPVILGKAGLGVVRE